MNFIYSINSIKFYINEQIKLNEEFVGHFEKQSKRRNTDVEFFLIAASFK